MRYYCEVKLHCEGLLQTVFGRLSLRSLLAGGLLTVAAAGAYAQNATWQPVPTVLGPVAATFDFNANPNWTPAIVPTGTASFGVTIGPNISFSAASTTLGGFTFNAGAPAYTFNMPANLLTMNGTGIVNNSSNKPTFSLNGSGSPQTMLTFTNGATAGNDVDFVHLCFLQKLLCLIPESKG